MAKKIAEVIKMELDNYNNIDVSMDKKTKEFAIQ